ITTAGVITQFQGYSDFSQPFGITAGPDGAIWFTESALPYNKIARLILAPAAPTTAAHDFNGDGKSDIAWRQSNNNAAIWLMNGATLSSGAGVGGAPSNWQIFGQRDFNGDSKHDLLWRDTTSGALAMWFLNGAAVSGAAGLGNVATNWIVAGTG